MLFSRKLYSIKNNEKTCKITDDESFAKQEIIDGNADSYEPINGTPISALNHVTDFDIIQNDSADREYGYSEIWKKDDGYGILMHQPRLDFKTIMDNGFRQAETELRELNKSYSDDATSLSDAVTCHLNFWLGDDKPSGNETPYAFQLNDDEITLLLKTGFIADMVIIFS